MTDEIQPNALQESLESGEPQLVDVRADHEWDAGHIPGAAHIPLEALSERAEEIDRGRPVIFYCRGGNRSGMAVQAFTEAGYEASKLGGGFLGWTEAGLPVEPEGGYAAESGEAAAVLEARRRDA
jgi:rhodanese-related sulfurtransferase